MKSILAFDIVVYVSNATLSGDYNRSLIKLVGRRA